MDFLRIRQKARERAREREESARAAATAPEPPVAPAVVPPQPASAPDIPPVVTPALLPMPAPDDGPPARAAPAPAPIPVPIPAPIPTMLPDAIPVGSAVNVALVGPGMGMLPAADPTTEAASALARELAQLEDALHAELTGVGAEARSVPAGDAATDPLDEFFWHEDETAPRLPDLVAASELPVPEPPPIRREWLTFRLGSEEYALEIEHVREVLKPPPLTEVPRAPADILGVIMVRGEVVAVIDPRARLGLPRSDPGPRARILVCDAGEASCGVLVDAVAGVIRLAPSSIEPRPAGVGGVAAEYIAGIGRERNRLYVLLDAPALLGDATGARAPGVAP